MPSQAIAFCSSCQAGAAQCLQAAASAASQGLHLVVMVKSVQKKDPFLTSEIMQSIVLCYRLLHLKSTRDVLPDMFK